MPIQPRGARPTAQPSSILDDYNIHGGLKELFTMREWTKVWSCRFIVILTGKPLGHYCRKCPVWSFSSGDCNSVNLSSGALTGIGLGAGRPEIQPSSLLLTTLSSGHRHPHLRWSRDLSSSNSTHTGSSRWSQKSWRVSSPRSRRFLRWI